MARFEEVARIEQEGLADEEAAMVELEAQALRNSSEIVLVLVIVTADSVHSGWQELRERKPDLGSDSRSMPS